MTDQPMASRFISNPQATAEHAYRKNYEGEWGLKASTEDAVAAILVCLRPDRFPTSASAIYQMREGEQAEQFETVINALWEDECNGMDVPELITRLLPRLAEVMS